MNSTSAAAADRTTRRTGAAPPRIGGRSTRKMIVTEAKLFVRDPLGAFFGIAFPTVLIVVLGFALPGFREPSAELDGRLPVEVYLPVVLALAIGTIALINFLNAIAADREKGVFRRLSTTPCPPIRLLVAQLVVNVAALFVGSGLALFAAWALHGVTARPNVVGLLLAFVLGAASMAALALLASVFTPTSRAAAGIGSLVYYPMLFAAGVWTPGPLMPEAVRRVADYVPLGAASQALQDTWAGGWPRPLHLVVLVGTALGFGALAARLFRWN